LLSGDIYGFADEGDLSRKGEIMAYQQNRTFRNGHFDQQTILAVWNKATIVPGYNQNEYRKDRCGAWIKFADYNNDKADFGWEIDHEKPLAKGGTDDLDNLQPLHWLNNRGKGDNWPNWSCSYQERKKV
jgi:5-methylcytosine-specific restriction endonuclease McrA